MRLNNLAQLHNTHTLIASQVIIKVLVNPMAGSNLNRRFVLMVSLFVWFGLWLKTHSKSLLLAKARQNGFVSVCPLHKFPNRLFLLVSLEKLHFDSSHCSLVLLRVSIGTGHDELYKGFEGVYDFVRWLFDDSNLDVQRASMEKNDLAVINPSCKAATTHADLR